MNIRLPIRAGLALFSGCIAFTAAAQSAPVALDQCVACHPISKGAPHGVGPNLHGIFGKPIAKAPGYVFSKALRTHGGMWTEEALHQWLEGPQSYAPGTKMAYAGLKDPAARQEVIDALKGLR